MKWILLWQTTYEKQCIKLKFSINCQLDKCLSESCCVIIIIISVRIVNNVVSILTHTNIYRSTYWQFQETVQAVHSWWHHIHAKKFECSNHCISKMLCWFMQKLYSFQHLIIIITFALLSNTCTLFNFRCELRALSRTTIQVNGSK